MAIRTSAVLSGASLPANVFAPGQKPSRTRDFIELVTAFTLIVITVWLPNPPQRAFFWITFAWIVISAVLRRDSAGAVGLGLTGFLRSLWIPLVALLLAGLSALVAQRMHTLHRLHGPTPLLSHIWGYMVWSVMQQFILQGYFFLRLVRLLPGRTAPLLTASAMFSVAHLPNPVLTPITLVWGVLACLLFLRYRNIYPLGLAHGILGLCVAVIVPNSINHNMRVGLGYLRYHPAQQRRSGQREWSPQPHRP